LWDDVELMLDDENVEVAYLLEPSYDGEDFLDDERREPERRLVEQDRLRIRHQGAPDHHHLLLAAREIAGLQPPALLEAREHVVDAIDAVADELAVGAGMPARGQILLDRKVRECARPCEPLDDAPAHHVVRRQLVEPLAVKLD